MTGLLKTITHSRVKPYLSDLTGVNMKDLTKIGDGEPDSDGNITYDKYKFKDSGERIDVMRPVE